MKRRLLSMAVALLALVAAGCGLDGTEVPSGGGTVTKVVDGDTIDVGGDRIRIIGIDTPERGECGYAEASNRVKELVLNQQVTLTHPSTVDDADRYGRLLRYVDVGDTDVALTLVNEGLAVARYDGEDGYERHPRQSTYRAADAEAADFCAR